MKKIRAHLHNKKNGGYTLVELVIVLALIAVLLGVTVGGIATYSKWAQFKQQNEYAETLFLAAQTQLTEYSQRGRLASLEYAASDNLVNLEIITNGEGDPANANFIWGSTDSTYQGAIYYLMGTAEDYAAYLDGSMETSDPLYALYEIFDAYLYDKTILSAAICIEFDPSEGLVYSVLYSNRNEGFTYGIETEGLANINDRSKEVRKNKMIGYYGVDTLSKATSAGTAQPVISDVTLHNGETLSLSYHLSELEQATGSLIYEIAISDADTNQDLLTIVINDSSLNTDPVSDTGNYLLVAEDSSTRSCTIEGKVTRYEEGGTVVDLGICTFPAYVDEENTIHLVLDAVDLGATTASYADSAEAIAAGEDNAFADTFSFLRFGLDVENIYCTVQGSGFGYMTTAKKQSNACHASFGQYTEGSATENRIYTIENARHLYNMRFVESDEDEDATTYTLVEDFAWDETIGAGFVYKDQTTVETINGQAWLAAGNIYKERFTDDDLKVGVDDSEAEKAFPSLDALREGSIFHSVNLLRNHMISGLILSYEANLAAEIISGEAEDEYTGLFLINQGEIDRIDLDRITVRGQDQTGAFCGVNQGTLSDLAVFSSDDSSAVTGEDYVGGITGRQDDAAMVYSEMMSEADVEGHRYVGGIVGAITVSGETIVTVENCSNAGQVTGETESSGVDESAYIGGIVGYCQNAGVSGDSLVIRGCVSSSTYNSEEIAAILADVGAHTKGVYVGGIVGLNEGATIENCNTLADEEQESYVFGGRYVGGIVGLNMGGTVSGDTQNNINQANVIGRSYVGGIVGANATVSGTENGFLAVDNTPDNSLILEDWVNEGTVVASACYAGGITGFNAGVIINCTSDVAYDDASASLSSQVGEACDYAGGVIGYNNGILCYAASNPDEITVPVFSVVSGRDYVGGIIGFNDESAEVRDYRLAGGYITGDVFVGGYAGLNLAEDLLSNNSSLSVSFSILSGSYCVGGVCGGNIIKPNYHLTTEYHVNNLLGKITGQGFVGGVLGYNLLLSTGDSLSIAETIIQSVKGTYSQMLTTLGSGISAIRSDYVMTIDSANMRLFRINAGIFVGGVIGYQDEASYLYLKNATNYTPIHATESVVYAEQGSGDSHRYSFAGGIIGKISGHVVVENCVSTGSGEVFAAGDYSGGLAEINRGLIFDCAAGNLGSGSTSYIGGLVGVNAPQSDSASFSINGFAAVVFAGEAFYLGGNEISLGIYDCTFSGNITGVDYVGGIAAENRGMIYAPVINGSITGNGQHVGGVTGYNYAEGTVTLVSSISIDISGSGMFVGGVIGSNAGNIALVSGSEAETVAMASDSNIVGDQHVGGIIGCVVAADTISGLVNAADVLATNGNVGGIVGQVALTEGETLTIENCLNSGEIQALEAGDAGGIVAENGEGCTIFSCGDRAAVIASNGIAGGIAGVNSGRIMDSFALQDDGTVSENPLQTLMGQLAAIVSGELYSGYSLSISAQETAGGIVGMNHESGIILDCTAANLHVCNFSTSPAGNLGGMVGENQGSVFLNATPVGEIGVSTYSNDSNLGGIAGWNSGEISGPVGRAQIGREEVLLSIGFAGSSAYRANFGGIAGLNNGDISNCAVVAEITGKKGSSATGYGGAAGVNGGAITGCSYDGDLYANGDSSNIANIGGIAGKNLAGATIEECVVGADETIITVIQCGTSTAAFSYLGGMVGWNYGAILCCDNDNESNAVVSIVGYAGHIGGMVGFNAVGGSVSGSSAKGCSTGENWIVVAQYYSNDCGTGGVMGYSKSGQSFAYVENHADVYNTSGSSGTSAVAGLVGRMENTVSSNLGFTYCANYGAIWSSGLNGGFVGRLKFNGCHMDYCYNYGEIGVMPSNNRVYFYTVGATARSIDVSSLTKPTQSGGLLATIYETSIEANAVALMNCGNFGRVYGRYNAGGIVGYITSCDDLCLYLTECVNTGVLDGDSSTQAAGILSESGDAGAVYLTRCRNYGLATATLTDASHFGGIAYQSVTKIQDCFSYSSTSTYPITHDTTTGRESRYVNDYYVYGTASSVDEDVVYIDSASFSGKGSVDYGYDLSYSYDGSGDVDTSSARITMDKNLSTKRTATITWTLAEPTTLTGFGIQWGNNGSSNTAYRYGYELYYTTAANPTSNDWVEIMSADAYGSRNTYVASEGCYIEVGFPDADQSIYYHPFTATGVTQIKVVINKAQTCTDSRYWENRNGWYGTYSDKSWSNTRSIIIRDTLGTRTGTLTAANVDDRHCLPVGSGEFEEGPALYGIAMGVGNSSGSYYLAAADGTSIEGLTYEPGDDYLADYADYQDYTVEDLSSLTSTRYQVIGELEPKWKSYYQSKYSTGSSPTSVSTPVDMGGAYRVSWTGGSGYCFEVSYRVVKDGQTLMDYGDEIFQTTESNKTIDVLDEWVGGQFRVAVRSLYYVQDGDGGYTEAHSAWTYSSSVTIKMVLAIPDAHLELLDDSSGNFYQVLLENAAEYPNGNITITFYVAGVSHTFSVGAGHSPTFAINSTGNQSIWMQATDSSGVYGSSPKRSVQSFVFSRNSLVSTNYLNTDFDGFYGAALGELYYAMDMTVVNGADIYVNSELLAYDEAIGTTVAVSYGEAHVTYYGLTMTATLTGLPDDLFSANDVLALRTYPWRTQGYMTYFGHVVGDNLNASAVKALAIFNGDGSLQDGYVVQKNADGTYRVIYSSILDYDASYAVQIDSHAIMVDNLALQPTPVIEPEYSTNTEGGQDTYTFVWDKDKYYTTANYHVTLQGISAQGSWMEMSLDTTAANYANGSWFVTFTDDNWNYPEVYLSVERIGVVDGSGRTTVYPSFASQTFSMKLRLSTITRPLVELHQYEDGTIEKNSLLFDISWEGLSSAAELAELDCYEVTVYGQTSGRTETFYSDGDATSLVADLNQFTWGETVEVSVRALAIAEAVSYRNGEDGIVREVPLPDRLAAPEMDPAVAGEGYGLTSNRSPAAVLSVAAFEDELLTLTMTCQTAETNGNYELALSIVDDNNESAQILEVLSNKDAVATMEGDLQESTYFLENISAAYAGQYLRVVMRSVSTSNISSVWTDAAASGVTPVYYIQLPKVQVETPTISETTRQYTYNALDTFDQSALSFPAVDYTDGYALTLVQEAVSVDTDTYVAYVDWLSLTQQGASYLVSYRSSDPAQSELIASLAPGGSVLLPYCNTVQYGASDPVDVQARILLSADGETFTLVLPDFDNHPDYGTAHATNNVVIQSLAADEADYVDSKLASWYRTESGAPVTSVFSSQPGVPSVDLTVLASEVEGEAFTISQSDSHRLLFELEVGGSQYLFSVPGSGFGPILSTLILSRDEFGQYAETAASIRVMAIVEGMGVSAWSDPYGFTFPSLYVVPEP